MNKDTLRHIMLNKRMQISQEDLKKYALIAVDALKNHPQYKKSKVVGIYHPIKNEIDITSIIKEDKLFLLPKVEGDAIHYYEFNKHSELEKSSLHIMEVKDGTNLDHLLELIIVPALAISKDFDRVGYGKGFFDRFIEKYPHIFTMSIVFDFQIVDKVHITSNDKKVHDIICIETEEKT